MRCSIRHQRIFATSLLVVIVALFGLIGGCEGPPEAIEGTHPMMDFSRSGGFYHAPFPSEDLRGSDGRPDVAKFPNPNGVSFIKKLLALAARDARGFARTGGVFFQLSGAIDGARLPTMATSITADATVFLIGVNKGSPDYGVRIPVTYKYEEDGGPMGAKHMLSMLPLQGRPLQAKSLYAAVIMRGLQDAAGQPLGVSLTMAQIAAGVQPEGLSDAAWSAYQTAIEALKDADVATKEIAGLAVFQTEDSLATMKAMVEYQRKQPLPTLKQPWKQTDLFDDFCVYQSSLAMPVYQQGTPPFYSSGGDWAIADDGTPQKQADEDARIVITIPRKKMPAKGWPTVLFVRTGGGGDRPLVDRGVREKAGGPAKIPGTGPALPFAKAGWAGVSVDGPHGGERNITKGDEQFLIFNIVNPAAMRDNIRQSALELTIVARLLEGLKLTVGDCPGLGDGAQDVAFDTTKLTLMGHSMGATIGPLAVALEPRFKAAILSGAGGSWIENIVHKRSPLHVRPIAEEILRYAEIKRSLQAHDPALTMLQWLGEAADPTAYAHLLIKSPLPDHAPRHVLMLQGIVDTYIMPPIANALSLALGLDLAGKPLDVDHKDLKDFTPLDKLLGFVGRKKLALPASGNLDGQTGLVIQHLQGPIEDGHEVVFQTEPPKHQYRCFLESLAKGTPSVPKAANDMMAPCK